MSRPTSQKNHASSTPLILLGAFLFICFAGTAQAFPWPWQSQKPLLDYSHNSNAEYAGYYEDLIRGPIVGIYLGEAYASVAIYRNESVEMIPMKDGSRVIPNVVKFTESETLIGEYLEGDPTHVIFNMERLIGRNFNDVVVRKAIKHFPFNVVNVDNKPRVEIHLKSKTLHFSPEEITAMVLREMKKKADEYLGADTTYAVVSVPADFNDAQRAAIKDAGTLAGLRIVRVVNEPTMAALAYNLDNAEMLEPKYDQYTGSYYAVEEDRKILVYNLGNHSFSASILNAEEGVFELLSTVRDLEIKSTSFNDSRFTDTIALLEKALLEARLNKTDITHIVILGGSIDVANMLEKHFGLAPLRDIDPNEVAAHGAAYHGHIMSRDPILGCYFGGSTPITLGIETSGGTFFPLIKRGTMYPTRKSGYFTTAVDGQTTVLIQVYEGVRPYTNVSNFIGEFELKGIPPAKKGVQEIEIMFDIDSNDFLKVIAKNMNNSITAHFPSYENRLNAEEIEKLEEEADKYYEVDHKVDQKNEIKSYAFHNGTRGKGTYMRLVENDST